MPADTKKKSAKLDKAEPKALKKTNKHGIERVKKKIYEAELARLQLELVKWQEWVREEKQRIVVIFEGRDAAGKGGVIQRIGEPLNPRYCRIAALGTPTERERTQWYFQRYVAELPTAGEIVLFDRSWYNRAGVERVMGFCTDTEYDEFLRACPQFEQLLLWSGIKVIKYWFSVSDDEQERRFQDRINNPMKNWKLSPMDVEARNRWVEYSKAKDEMFRYTDLDYSPWWVVEADDKRSARLNCITHLLSQFDYSEIEKKKITLPPRRPAKGYIRPPKDEQRFVPLLW
ncbi:MAG: polyphosphate kinase 2 [Rhodospirillales bacterium]